MSGRPPRQLERWMPCRDSRGIWQVVDVATRTPVFSTTDPLRRLLNIHLAALSPELHAFSVEMLRATRTTGWGELDHRRSKLIHYGEVLVASRMPPLEEFMPLMQPEAPQQTLPITAEGEVA